MSDNKLVLDVDSVRWVIDSLDQSRYMQDSLNSFFLGRKELEIKSNKLVDIVKNEANGKVYVTELRKVMLKQDLN